MATEGDEGKKKDGGYFGFWRALGAATILGVLALIVNQFGGDHGQ